MRKIVIPKRLLVSLYDEQSLGIPEIARIMNIGKTTVHRWLKRYKIERRSMSEAKRSSGWTGQCLDCGKDVGSKTLCKSCTDKRDYQKYKEQRKQSAEKYYQEKVKGTPEHRAKCRIYRNKNRDCINFNQRKYSRTSKYFKVSRRLRERVRHAFKAYTILGKTKSSDKYGISYKAIFEYLGPCPGDTKDYHIDHIIPLSAFDLENSEHIKLAFSPENHQWLLVEENLIKHSKIPKESTLSPGLQLILREIG